MYKWSVNWQFVPEWVFVSKGFALLLLGLHLAVLWLLFRRYWTRMSPAGRPLTPGVILWVLYSCQLPGIIFARSLHYQFYSWYFYTVPYLLWCGPQPLSVRVGLLVCLEWVWNLYPPHMAVSLLMLATHIAILALCVLATDAGAVREGGTAATGKTE